MQRQTHGNHRKTTCPLHVFLFPKLNKKPFNTQKSQMRCIAHHEKDYDTLQTLKKNISNFAGDWANDLRVYACVTFLCCDKTL